MPEARPLLLSPSESSQLAWSEGLSAGLRWCLTQDARREESPKLTLVAFLEAFLDKVFFQPLSDLLEQARLDARLPYEMNSLIDFFAAALMALEAELPTDVSFRLLPLLRIDHFPALDVDDSWEAGVAAVQQFMAGQLFSEQCRARCQAVLQHARKSFKELGRDWDLDSWMRPPTTVLPWERLVVLWVEDRLAEVGRTLRPHVHVSPETLELCLKAAKQRCQAPTCASAAPLESVVSPALKEARERKWSSFCESFKSEKSESTSQKTTTRDRDWEELERELQDLRTAIKTQLDDSIHTSQLFHS